MKLPYSNIAICNAGFNANMGRILGSSDAHQSNESAYAMASDPESTRFISLPSSGGPDTKAASQYENISYRTVKYKISEEEQEEEGPGIEAAGQYEDISYPTVNQHDTEEAVCNDSNFSSWLLSGDWEEEISQLYREEDADFESFLHQDPNQSGWLESADSEDDTMSISGPYMPDGKERENDSGHDIPDEARQQDIPEEASLQLEEEDLNANWNE